MQLILASQSPRRRSLMALLRLPYTVCAVDIDEAMDPAKPPAQEVARVSRAKALAAARAPSDIVIAADTIVVCGDKLLGKPKDPAQAAHMLRLLSDRQHQVMTGLTVLRGDRIHVSTEITDIRFRPLSEREIDAYIRTGEPMDKAGAYGIQGGAALFVQEIHGDYYNVVGLPVCKLWQVLCQIAPEITEEIL